MANVSAAFRKAEQLRILCPLSFFERISFAMTRSSRAWRKIAHVRPLNPSRPVLSMLCSVLL